ncbi:hypothetical protein M405DRAFT_891008 [Rhizopogon salebrosus TDB-379]|nr:hypothetical protein M405DRAFT_891008 [Rhizopogon salebrosus TDB-379]
MGREKSWLWQHFHQGSAKVDKVHWQACCKYCVKVKVKELENADQQAVTHGILQAARTSAILTQEACDNVPYIAGKHVNMSLTVSETYKRGRKRRADEDEEGPSKASAGAASTKLHLASASSDNITMTRNLSTQHKFNVIAMKAVPFGPSKQEAFSAYFTIIDSRLISNLRLIHTALHAKAFAPAKP